MFYHGTNVGGIKELKPSLSNQGKYVYFSDERLRIIPYLVNPVQKFVDDKYGKGKYKTSLRWARFTFINNKLVLIEAYPNYIEDTFKGQIGYIYYFENIEGLKALNNPHTFGLDKAVKVEKVEVIPDVYDEILRLEKDGKLVIKKYEENTEKENRDFEEFVKGEMLKKNKYYNEFYREFLREKFPQVFEK